MPRWIPPVPLVSASNKESFAYESTVKRWPIILTGVVDELARINGTLAGNGDDKDKVTEGKQLINDIGGLIYEMRHDRELPPLQPTGYPDDTSHYNDELAAASPDGKTRWFNASWLYAECYLYRRLRGLFATTQHWNQFDPFASQKLETWRSSAAGAAALAKSLQKLVEQGKREDEAHLRRDYIELMEICLWGNATDLSLLTSLSHEEIQALQSVERGREFTLRDDLDQTWEYVKGLKDARFDIVLDNSGFELFTDMILADFLVTLSPFCSQVVFHPKLMPWFVSDVNPHDFLILLDTLSDESFFPDLSDEDKHAFKVLVTRWKRYVEEGKFRLSVPKELKMGQPGGEIAEFWTTPYSFADLPAVAPELLKELQKASLVIFKGDLNYRKLVSDAAWPPTTPFHEALGPLAGKINLLSLRTCKADPVVGLEEGIAEGLDEKDPKWRVNGKYAVVSFAKKD
ncbi:hypothetical protein JCM1840_002700 [Sporobolomyces johnsonii]